MKGKQVTVRYKKDDCDDKVSLVEIDVPMGLKRTEVGKLLEKVIGGELERFAPRGCQNCMSGLDFRIRERFENVVQMDF